jgi:hypothetical protein
MARTSGATLVLLTLASGQFLMTLDTSVMNVSIARDHFTAVCPRKHPAKGTV